MRILLTGGTGLIGSALLKHWQSEHQLTVLTRTARPGSTGLQYVTDLAQVDFNLLDAVINLAGEPIADKRWSEAQKNRICQSRWQLTEELVGYIQQASTPPHTLLNASAVGFYGRQGSDTGHGTQHARCRPGGARVELRAQGAEDLTQAA